MAVLLQIKNAHKSYGDQVLLDGAETTLSDDVKYGFVGRNGAGKSTRSRVLLPAPLRPTKPTFTSSVSVASAPSSNTWSP